MLQRHLTLQDVKVQIAKLYLQFSFVFETLYPIYIYFSYTPKFNQTRLKFSPTDYQDSIKPI